MLAGPVARAERVNLAVATNFIKPMQALKAEFEAQSHHTLTLSFASSGKLFAQIKNGAPFDVFLSADQAKPLALAQTPFAIADSRFTYAQGSLVLWSADNERLNIVGDATQVLAQALGAKRIAIANPRLAPYGMAAQEVLDTLNFERTSQQRIVRGESVSQVFQFVSTGNAEVGFIAASQLWIDGEQSTAGSGSSIIVPGHLHSPIKQDAILLSRAETNQGAIAFLEFLRSPETQQLIKSFGYSEISD